MRQQQKSKQLQLNSFVVVQQKTFRIVDGVVEKKKKKKRGIGVEMMVRYILDLLIRGIVEILSLELDIEQLPTGIDIEQLPTGIGIEQLMALGIVVVVVVEHQLPIHIVEQKMLFDSVEPMLGVRIVAEMRFGIAGSEFGIVVERRLRIENLKIGGNVVELGFDIDRQTDKQQRRDIAKQQIGEG